MIGYYVHHRGRGHVHRMATIAGRLTEPVTGLSSLPTPTCGVPGPPGSHWLQLPLDDHGDKFADPTARGTLHWVPQHHGGLRRRMGLVAGWIDRVDPDLMVVDVSVEVSMLSRLMGVPTVLMAMRGDRTDGPHRMAYDAAHALVAPWSAEFAEPQWPSSWQRKTFFAGAISRFGHLDPPVRPAHSGPRRVLALWGSGGDRPTAQLTAAMAATPGWSWRVADAPDEPGPGGSVWDLLGWADVVLTHAGQNAVAEVAAAGVPAVVIADDRPHGEQLATAATLDRAVLATGLVGWPDPERWDELLTTALRRGGSGWRRWSPQNGTERAAQFLERTAGELRSNRATGRWEAG